MRVSAGIYKYGKGCSKYLVRSAALVSDGSTKVIYNNERRGLSRKTCIRSLQVVRRAAPPLVRVIGEIIRVADNGRFSEQRADAAIQIEAIEPRACAAEFLTSVRLARGQEPTGKVKIHIHRKSG